MLILPQRYKYTPLHRVTVDWSHPLARGLITCWVPGLYGGIDLTGRSPPLMKQSAATFGNTPDGPGLKSTATSSGLTRLAVAAEKSYTECTLYWRGYQFGATVPDFSTLIGVSYTTTDTAPYVICGLQASQVSAGAPNDVWIAAWNTNGTVTTTEGGPTLTIAAGILSFGATFVVNGNVTVYNQGASIGTKAFGAIGPTSSSDSTMHINAWVPVNTRHPNATCNIACMWDRALTANEMLRLQRWPYSMLKSVRPSMGGQARLYLRPDGDFARGFWSKG